MSLNPLVPEARWSSRRTLERFSLEDHGVVSASLADDVRRGLAGRPKSLPPHHFYDEAGSVLFDAITWLPEYYLTRSEAEILTEHATEIAAAFGDSIRLIELGAGSSRKTRLLLAAITASQPDLEYVPVDIDPTVLEKSAGELLNEHRHLRIRAIRSDFRTPSRALARVLDGSRRNVVLFLGSTIGNLDQHEAVDMFRDLRSALSPGDLLLVGADLRKPKEILEAAYDDRLGVTAAFNINLLHRINRELGGHFDVAKFDHRAFYDETAGRIEMHLVSREAQRVRIDDLDLDVEFEAGESIHTENSRKYDRATIEQIAEASGFTCERTWTDNRSWFADFLLRAAG